MGMLSLIIYTLKIVFIIASVFFKDAMAMSPSERKVPKKTLIKNEIDNVSQTW